ncbi:hypothetical protein QZH41_009257 [Actinostola sp. cb2023]|nr:hypothetical protein QZH41_009257 [Actinostola sp. cb2023]
MNEENIENVLNRIKKSCSDINEEELAKLGVQLLNCQSLAENRKTFECTDEMSIAQCTSNMDSETWNSYHIISNRARSVCYATRQQQFRLKTEYAVNQLGKQAGEQLQLMDTLKTGQSKLAHIAADTVEKMTAGQKKLIAQQRRIHLSQVITQHTIENGINRNIEGLSRENSLIDKNHAQLASMTYNINNKLENATKLLRNQEKNLVESHHEILHDLNDIRVKAQDVWNKLDDSADRMLRNQKESTDHYNDTIDNLKRINKTISYLLEAIDATQSKLDDRITWLTHQLMSTGYQISTMVTCLMHAGYFVLSTYGIVFVQAPGFTRIALVVIVPVNALCEINLGSSLTFAYLTALLITVLIGKTRCIRGNLVTSIVRMG